MSTVLKPNVVNLWVKIQKDLRVWAGVLEDLEHTGARDLPDFGGELLPVQNHQVLQTVCP